MERDATILLVVNGTRGQQVVFVHPPPIQSSATQMSSAPMPSSTVAPINSSEKQETADAPSEYSADRAFGIPSEVLARLMCPAKGRLSGCLLQLTVGQLLFITLPCALPALPGKSCDLAQFSISLALDINLPPKYLRVYSHLLTMVTRACVREQKRVGFLTNHLTTLSTIREHQSDWREIKRIAMEQSALAREMVTVVESIRHGRPLQVRINSWVELSLRLPAFQLEFFPESSLAKSLTGLENPYALEQWKGSREKRRGAAAKADRMVPSDVFRTAPRDPFDPVVNPYEALRIRQSAYLEQPRPRDGLRSLSSIIDAIIPSRTMQQIAETVHTTEGLACAVASHLMQWGMTRPVTQLGPLSIIVLSSQAPVPPPPDLESKFRHEFPNFPSLLECMSIFRFARTMRDYEDAFESKICKQDLPRAIAWLLCHRILKHLDTYVFLLLSAPAQIPANPCEPLLRTTCGGEPILTELEWSNIQSSTRNPEAFELFKRVMPFFNGAYSLHEIMFRANVTQEELDLVLSAFSSILQCVQL